MTEKWGEIQGKLDLVWVTREFELSELELSGFNCIWTLQFMHNERLHSPFNALIVISKKRPLWSSHLGPFFIFSFDGGIIFGKVVFFLNTYSNYLKTAANSNDQFQHQDLDLLCLSITF